jgi:pimeloyl-ACP methyl ester carboxylesterase
MQQKQTITINGHKIYYELSSPSNHIGNPPLLVLLHTGLGTLVDWHDQVTPLNKAGFQVLTYDRWGYGQSDERPKFESPHFFYKDVEDLDALLDFLGIKSCTLVGHSDGGTLALLYTANYAERVTQLVIVAAHIYIEAQTRQHVIDLLEQYKYDERLRHGLQKRHGVKTENLVKSWAKCWMFTSPKTIWGMQDLLPTIEQPALVAFGTNDSSASLKHAREIYELLPNAEFWLVDGVGHMLVQELGERFADKIINYLSKNTIRN